MTRPRLPHTFPRRRCFTQIRALFTLLQLSTTDWGCTHQAVNGNWTRSYSYNEASLIEPTKQSNRLSSTTMGKGVPEPYTYDAHGNMTRMNHLPLMQWDYRDQLQATAQQVINNGVPETTWYVYDASGQRMHKVTESAVSAQDTVNGKKPKRKNERIYLGGFEIYRDYENDGVTVKLERETLHIMDDKQRIALVETKTKDISVPANTLPETLIRYQFGNHLGSAILELDDQAQIISYEEYTPYGSTSYQAVRSQTETPKRYRYTGKERDEESGLYYHGARYYAAWLGKWASVDPSGLRAGSNLYFYSYSNPVVFVDRNGKWPSGSDFAEMGNTLLGYGEGLGQSAVSMVTGVAHMIVHPIETAQGIGHVVAHPIETARAVGAAATQAGHEFMAAIDRGDTRAAGRMIGNVVGAVVLPAAGAKVVARLGQTARVAVVARRTAQAERAAAAATKVEQGTAATTRAVTMTEVASDTAKAETMAAVAARTEPAVAAGAESATSSAGTAVPVARVAQNQSSVPLPNPGESKLGYGTRVHQELPRIIGETNPGASGRFNVAPGLTGPDLMNPTGMNAAFAEMKSLWGRQAPMVSQARNWGFDAQAGRYFFYDRNTGTVLEGIIQTEKFPSGAFRP